MPDSRARNSNISKTGRIKVDRTGHNLYFCLAFILFSMVSCAQNNQKVYNPEANANEDLSVAIESAKGENKHVLLQIGGNWCPWCLRLHKFITEDKVLDSLMRADYIVLKINYDKEGRSSSIMESLDFPQRFGFPVIVILDSMGNRIHTQNSAYLEKDKSYDRKKLIDFLKQWTVRAVDPKTYLHKKS